MSSKKFCAKYGSLPNQKVQQMSLDEKQKSTLPNFTQLTILTHSVMLSSSWWCLVSCLIERMVLRRASYASNRDKLGSKNSLYQSTSSLHASEQVMTKSNKSLSPLSSSPSSPASPSSPWSCSSLSWWWWFQSSPSPAPSPSPTTPGPRHASPGGHRLPGHHAGHGHGHDDECHDNDDDAENSNNLITMVMTLVTFRPKTPVSVPS